MNRSLFMPSLQFASLSGLALTLTSILGGLPAQAQVPLTRADVESLYNQVEFIPEGQAARPANLSDWLSVGDALRTTLGARAELRFNDGSLARVGERATFWFVPNTRDFRLSNGTALFLIPPGQGPSNIRTPSAVTGIQGTALVVRHIPRPDCDLSSVPADELACPGRTVVMVLTDSPKGPVEVSTASGNSAALSAGDLAVIENDAIQVLNFNLQLFYDTSPLVQGLSLDESDYEGTGSPTDPVRQETWDGIQSQEGFEGSYLLNPELISNNAQLGVSTSWLLPVDRAGDPLLTNGGTDTPVDSVNAVGNQMSAANSGSRALMSSWFNNASPTLSVPQASVPGVIMPAGAGPQPVNTMRPIPSVSNPTSPTVVGGSGQQPRPTSNPGVGNGGGPTTSPVQQPIVQPQQPFDPGGAPTPTTPVQPEVDPVVPTQPGSGPGGPTTPQPPVTEPVAPTTPPEGTPGGPEQPGVPFDPGGGPTQPGPVDNPVEQPITPPVDNFNPPGNPDPTGDPNFSPPGSPNQPQGVPFDPAGGPGPAPAPDVTGAGGGGGPTTPIPEVNTGPPPIEPVPEASAPPEFPSDVLLEAPPSAEVEVETPVGDVEIGI